MKSENQWADMLPLESQRLILRRLNPEDLGPFLEYHNDPEVARFQSWGHFDSTEARAFLAQQQLREIGKPGQWLQMAITLKPAGHLIGDCALKIMPTDTRQATMGITLSRPNHGRGLAAEAVSAILNFVFLTMRLHRVQADTDPDNPPAWKLLERLGMRREAHHQQSLWFKGRWADEYIYAMLNQEWLAQIQESSRSF